MIQNNLSNTLQTTKNILATELQCLVKHTSIVVAGFAQADTILQNVKISYYQVLLLKERCADRWLCFCPKNSLLFTTCDDGVYA